MAHGKTRHRIPIGCCMFCGGMKPGTPELVFLATQGDETEAAGNKTRHEVLAFVHTTTADKLHFWRTTKSVGKVGLRCNLSQATGPGSVRVYACVTLLQCLCMYGLVSSVCMCPERGVALYLQQGLVSCLHSSGGIAGEPYDWLQHGEGLAFTKASSKIRKTAMFWPR